MKLSDAIGLELERREKDADDFLPICVPENAAEIRRIYKEQRELVAAQQDRIEKLDAELAALREAVDEVLNASVSSLEYRSNRLQLAMWGLRAVRDKALLKQEGG